MSKPLRIYSILIVLICLWTISVPAQLPTESDRARRAALNMLRHNEIPEASLDCSPEEAKWWSNLRLAAMAVQENRWGKKEKDKFLRLLHEGQQKSYQPPVPNRPITVLSRAEPRYTEEARIKKIRGSVALVVEVRPDGYVGDVEVVQGLDAGLDESAVEAAHRIVFLPPVKDRKFVSFRMPMTMSFNIY
jgi:TonB family protein